jgi:nucleoside-diphosphate-sugar epimerase
MAVMITGGAGFVGSHLVDACIDAGEEVVVFDNLSTGKLSNLELALESGRATFVYQDVAVSKEKLAAGLARAGIGPITQIFHLASPASPEAYGAHPWATLAVNGTGTMALIDLALEIGAQMVFTSTSEVYGDPLVHPQPEDYFGNVNPIGPRACYDEGKRFGEAAMSVAVRERGLDGRIVRIFNCYGPRMDVGDGRLIPALLEAARNKTPFAVHGSGRQTRSMTYVDDLIAGLLAVSEWKSPALQPVNLGNPEEHSVEEILQAFVEVAGVELQTVAVPARPEDPQRRRPVTTVAESLGWTARVPLVEGLRRTYAWFTTDALEYA